MRLHQWLAALGLMTAVTACGGQELTTPSNLPVRTYAAGESIRLTVVMTNCSDTCSEYETPSCSSEVDGETIKLDIAVPFGERSGVDASTLSGCSITCGPQVIAHCDVGALSAGSYTVEAGGFEAPITVR